MSDFNNLSNAVQSGKAPEAEIFTKILLENGNKPGTILNNGLLHGMSIIGRKFKAGEIYIPQVLISARAMKSAMTILEPLLIQSGVKPKGKALIGTVRGDVHDIGKNLVIIMLKGAGYNVKDLGIDLAPEAFVEKAKSGGFSLIGLSALLTTTMPMIKKTIQAFIESGMRDEVKIIIGGAPVSEKFAKEAGADGFAADASSAVDVFNRFNVE